MYHLIINPVAGKKRAIRNLAVAERRLTERGLPFQTHKTNAVRDGARIARALTEAGEDELIVLGGDGTLHEVLNGVVDPSKCKLGLIPSGTGNDFAGRLGIPLDAERAMEIILSGEAKPVDFLQVDGVRCMNVAGVGMDVDVLERCQLGRGKGKGKYLRSLLRSLFAFKGLPITVVRDGQEERHNALLAATCNGSRFGGGITICPPAVVDDGKMDVVLVDCIGGKMKIIKAFLKLLKGKILEYPAATHFLCEEIKIERGTDCPVQLDGELYRGIEFCVSVGKGLRFYRE